MVAKPPSTRALALVVSLACALLSWAPRARADVAPPCCDFADTVTCTDLGTPCPTGGTCREVSCGGDESLGMTGTAMTLDKCLACPRIVAADAGECDGYGTSGESCGAGGTCREVPAYCVPRPTNGAVHVIACAGPLDWDGQAPPDCNGTAPGDAAVADAESAVHPSEGETDATTAAGDGAMAEAGPTTHAAAGASGGGCAIGPREASNIVLAWLFAAAVPVTLRRFSRKKGRRP